MKQSLALLPALLGFLLPLSLNVPLVGAQVVSSGEGQSSGPTSSGSSAGYSCDPSKCQLPDCHCASTDPPGGISPSDTPMFIVFTADDAVQSYTLDSVNQFLAHRKNPNGCAPKMTYYASLNYTNYTLITDWFVAGNEIADHTMTHMADPSSNEINGNLIALNALAGIPMSSIQGFRAPYLNYSVNTLKYLHEAGFTYDSSASSCTPVNDPDTDAFWPYTLDSGMANDCLMVEGICKGEPKLPGFWEVPMYCFFDKNGVAGTHLMDPWLDMANGNTQVDNKATLDYLKSTFTDHYNAKRQPIGLYTHPIHLSTTYPGVNADKGMIDMINEYLDWAQQQQNVWIVSTEQLLAWVRNPVPVSQLDSFEPLKCSTPDVSEKICNGMPANEEGLVGHCAFNDSPFYTCYGCPKEVPTVSNPNPEQDVKEGEQARFRLPSNCTTAFWDPIKGNCICNADTCAFNDDSRPIGPNGANLTGGGTGGGDANPSASADPYVPFNGGGDGALPTLPAGTLTAILVAVIGSAIGTMGIFARL